MTSGRPWIVVSIPARGVSEAVAQVAKAAAAGADAAELRLDRWPPEERSRVSEIFPSPLPLVATLRSRREGGEGPDDPPERAVDLLRLAALPFRWIDVEYERDGEVASRLPPIHRIGRIVSSHLAGTGSEDWSKRWRELAREEGIGKLVVPASVPVALDEIVPAVAARADARVIVHTVGRSGPLLRALSSRLHAPMVFAALPEEPGQPPVEPSQIPVDRLRSFLDAPGDPPLFGVAGSPVSHSLSPSVHSAWMKAERRAGLYVALEFADDDEFLRSLPLLASNGFRGLNVTQPFKEAAFEGASEAGPSAEVCRAANCLAFREGEVVAENTDLAAILRRLEELRDGARWNGRSLTVLGAGGAARATLAAARELGARAQVVDRKPDHARQVASEFGAAAVEPAAAQPEPLVVNATSAGRSSSGPIGLPLGGLVAPGGHLLDWVYRPDEPSVKEAAQSAGATYEDGWRVFVYQAAASYAIWWGEAPSTEAVDRAITEGPCAA